MINMSFSHKTSMRPFCGLAIAAFFMTNATPAAAEKSTVASTLFAKGIELMEQEKYDRACPYLDESYHRDPLLGALIALADCEYERGRLATALKRYQEYVDRHDNLADVARQKQGSRLREAKAKVEELTSSVPTIKITVPKEAKIPILHLDGIRIKPDVAYPVDPGKYEVTFDVFGSETARTTIEASKGQKKIVAMDPGKPVPQTITKRLPGPESNITTTSHDGSWKTGIVLMSIGMLGYLSVYFTAGPISKSGVPGSTISVGLGGALTLTGAFLTTRSSSTDVALRRIPLLPVVNVGGGPERPMYFGIQGRF
jgi:hypothetical protein